MTRLIINGDDFGMSPAVNEAIVRAHRQGILTSASLMVNAPAWEEAVKLAQSTPGLQVGLHLTLLQGRSTLPPSEIPGLVDVRGNFPNDPVGTGMRYFFRRSLRGQLHREITAQLERFQATGLKLDHLDGHLNIHLHPTVLGILLELAGRYGIRSLRVTRDEFRTNVRIDPRHRPRKLMENITFRLLARHARRRLDRQGIAYTGRVFGLHQSGDMNEDYLLQLLEGLQVECAEIYFHPGVARDAELVKWMPGYHHVEEFQALVSPRVREVIEKRGIRLVTYSELRKEPDPC